MFRKSLFRSFFILFSVLALTACPKKDDVSPAGDSTSLKGRIDFGFWDTKLFPTCGGAPVVSKNVKFGVRKSFPDEFDSSYDFDCHAPEPAGGMRLWPGSTWIIDTGYYKDVTRVVFKGVDHYCSYSAVFQAIDKNGKLIEEIMPDIAYGKDMEVTFEKKLGNLKEIRVFSICEVIDISTLTVYGL